MTNEEIIRDAVEKCTKYPKTNAFIISDKCQDAGRMIDLANELYPGINYQLGTGRFTFTNESRLYIRYVQNKQDFDGQLITWLYFDAVSTPDLETTEHIRWRVTRYPKHIPFEEWHELVMDMLPNSLKRAYRYTQEE